MHELTCVYGCRKHADGQEISEQFEIVPMKIRAHCGLFFVFG
ncbi:hypothetical protein [Pseudomonas umsongensis]|jgi:hypothetical protein|nr:hypothetical protein [Pseudomonas umsongensis]